LIGWKGKKRDFNEWEGREGGRRDSNYLYVWFKRGNERGGRRF
jgi:hypothetical protein